MRHHSQFHLLSIQFMKKTYSLTAEQASGIHWDLKFVYASSTYTAEEEKKGGKCERNDRMRSNAHESEEIVECNLTVETRWLIIDMIRSRIPVEDWRGESEQSTHIHTNNWTESRIVCANNDRFCNVLHATCYMLHPTCNNKTEPGEREWVSGWVSERVKESEEVMKSKKCL